MSPNLEKIAKYNKKISDINEKTISMLKGLLKLSRQPDHRLHSVKFLEVWESLYPLVENKLKYAGIELQGNFREHMDKRYLALVEYLAQVFLNLIINSIHSIEENCKKNERRYIQIDVYPGKSVTLFEISDSGPGVPEELIDKIFVSYFTTKQEGTGTGLGLSICRTVMERMDGEIQTKKINNKNFFEVRVLSDDA
ncbi:MAG: HAMP domain-containing histidine kinase [Deltaproteobacteria bacterium]|nr:MAG: HAMP domain-containing histidine kinase [Deltaproteobacteria bacterium]